MSHNEECKSESSSFGCPVCEEICDDDPALKNHILDVHLQPELLDVKQEPGDSMGEDDIPSTEHDDTDVNEGNKKTLRRRRAVRQTPRKSKFISENLEDGDLDSFGAHFLHGYGNCSFN